MNILTTAFVFILIFYVAFPVLLFLLWEILGIIILISPNKYTKILLEFIFPENRENILLKLLQKLYPFLF